MTQLDDNDLAIERASEILDQLGIGVLALDRSGGVAFHNSSAQSMFSRDMRVARSTIAFADPRNSSRYAERVETLRGTGGGSPAGVDPMVIARADSSPLLLRFIPARRAGDDPSGIVSTIVLLRPVQARDDISEARVRAAFGLTASEARLAAKLSGGATLAEIADELNISINTARVHLRTIFRKTNTHRQSQLVALLGSLA